MKLSWLPREPGHWKLVVEPLNVLLGLKRVESGYLASCLGKDLMIPGDDDELPAKAVALHWFGGVLDELEKELGQLRSEGA